ncbi:phage protein [Pantoea agglomerans]|uniref:phage protein n=1 Tax=Enterobacter agglomerans TaxID=549 RepID=UPI003965BAE9
MTAIKQYGRQYILTIGNSKESIQINNLRVAFSITHTHDKTPNRATLRVWNLNPSHRHQVTGGEFKQVALAVGYGSLENCRVLYAGQITKPAVIREGLDFILELTCDDGATAYRDAFVNVTLAAGSTHEDVIAHCAGEMTGITPGNIGLLADVTFTRAKVCYGPARHVMTQVADHHGADWMIQNGELHVLHPDYCLPDEGALLNEASGMLGSPKPTDRGLEVSCLLRPEITVGSLVRVESIVADYGGDYKAVAVKSDGDTHASRWESRLTLVNGKFKQAKKLKKRKKKDEHA